MLDEKRAVVLSDSSCASQEGQKSQGALVLTQCMAPVFWKCARQGLVSLSTTEAELQMLCEGSLATKNVGMLVKETTKPMKDFQERKKTIQELNDKEEFQADEDEPIEGEEDVLLVDNKAATLILVQVSGSWRTRHLRVRASALKQRVDLGEQKVCHVPGRSMLADLNMKSHPQARLTALRKMWSIEKMYPDEVPEIPADTSEEEKPQIGRASCRER